jgi:ABC-type transport system involved in multi-copper enzyme maturation permease subunit
MASSVLAVMCWIVFAAIDSHFFYKFTPILWLVVAVGAVIAYFIPKLICIIIYWIMEGFRKDRGK